MQQVRSRPARRPVALGAVLALAATVLALAGPPAGAAPAAEVVVSGRVRSEVDGTALAGLQVRLYRGPAYTSSSATTTDATGGFRFEVPVGSYKLWFRDVAGGIATSEYFEDATTLAAATVVEATTPGTRYQVEAELAPKAGPVGPTTGLVRGHVATAAGAPAAGVQVRLYRGPEYTSSSATTTDAAGDFRFDDRAAGTYKLWFRAAAGSGLLSEYLDDQPTLVAATPITFAPGQVVTTSTTLALVAAPPATTGTITGRVTTQAGAPIPGIQVRAYRDATAGSAAAVTDADGRYSLVRPPGGYRLWFRDLTSTSISEYHDDGESLERGTSLVLAAGGSLVVDAALSPRTDAIPLQACRYEVARVTAAVEAFVADEGRNPTSMDDLVGPMGNLHHRPYYVDLRTDGSAEVSLLPNAPAGCAVD